MQVGQLTVSLRTGAGKGAAHRLRAAGLVPGVCYGESTDGRIQPVNVTVDVKALKAALDPVRKQNTVIALSIEDAGKPVRTLSALVKDFQIDPIRRDVTHVDLLAIDPNKEVNAVVPLDFVGKPAGTINGGLLHTVMRSCEVKCKPSDIPVKLELDISPLDIGDVLHVSDIKLPDGVRAVTAGREAVISMVAPEVDKAAEAAAAEAAAAPAKDAKAAPAKDAKAAAAPAKDAKAKK